MLFEQALLLLQSGSQVHREAWTPEDGYLVLLPGMKYVWKIVLVPNPNAGNYIFSVEDFTATDWVEHMEPFELEIKTDDPASP